MEKTISIRICTGTTCYVMGASDLLTLEDYIPENLKGLVKISGSTCLGMCRHKTGEVQSDASLKPPFVEINGRTIGRASIPKVLDALEAEGRAVYAHDK